MNSYAKHTITRFYHAYTDQLFDQDDVVLFLVLARDYAQQNSILRELGDFLAHPDAKDRGLTLASVDKLANDFEQNCEQYFRDSKFDPPLFKGLGQLTDLLSDLRGMFMQANLALTEMTTEDDSFRQFVFCVICLLGACSVKHKDRIFELSVEYSHSFSLLFRYESLRFPQHFAVLPLLQLANVWVDCPSVPVPTKYELKNIIARRFNNKLLAAIAYDDEPQNVPRTESMLASVKIWQLPPYVSSN
jgi:hypothetical protein